MPKEYLEREAICKNCNNKDSCFPYPEMRVKCPVYKTSTAEVELVRHGEWRLETEYYDDEYSECNTRKVFACSLCGRTEKTKQPYCNCGAKMDGGNK